MNLNNDDSMTHKSTNVGSIFSLVLILVLLSYLYQKVHIFIARQKIDIVQTSKEGYYPEDHVFTWDNGFNIAVALTAYDSE